MGVWPGVGKRWWAVPPRGRSSQHLDAGIEGAFATADRQVLPRFKLSSQHYVKDLPQLADEPQRQYRFVAIDRATRWVFIGFAPAKRAAAAQRFLGALHLEHPKPTPWWSTSTLASPISSKPTAS